jgi:hypothetical protein
MVGFLLAAFFLRPLLLPMPFFLSAAFIFPALLLLPLAFLALLAFQQLPPLGGVLLGI